MKRYAFLLALILSFYCTSATADGNAILFRNISWGSNPFTFEEKLAEDKIVSSPTDYSISKDYTLLDSELRSSYALVEQWQDNDFPFFTRYIRNPSCQVAGYDLFAISANFLPSFSEDGFLQTDVAHAHLFSSTYVIRDFSNGEYQTSEEAYRDLQEKLSGLYGAGTPVAGSTPSVIYWCGDDATCVALCLYKNKYGDTIQIQYYSGVTREETVAIKTAYMSLFEENTDGL